MPAIKQAWEAESWEELQAILDRDHDGEGFDWIKKLILQRDNQRVGDKFRNERRRAILAYTKEHPEVLPATLRK